MIPIYLDHNATTPVDERVLEAMIPFLSEHFGNPSSSHKYGDVPEAALDQARGQVAALIGAHNDEIVFTGNGTESDHLAIRGAAHAAHQANGRRHIVTQPTEHPAVLKACHALELQGWRVSLLDVDDQGVVDPAQLAELVTDETSLVTVMHANNETGTVQPIAELADIAHRRGALFHTDAAQSVGKIHVDVGQLGVDLLTLVGHKMNAPKGVAALYVRRATPIEPQLDGGGQERGRRSGTENVAFAVGLGTAAQLAQATLPTRSTRLRLTRDRLLGELEAHLPGKVLRNGQVADGLPNTLNVSISGTRGDRLLLDAPGVAAATGSACHADSVEPSPVLVAMGMSPERALAAIRFSVGVTTTEADVVAAAAHIATAAGRAIDTPRH